MAKYAKRAKHATRSFTKCLNKTKEKAQHPANADGEIILPSMMRERTRKIAASAAALAIVGALAAPMPAWAADWVQVAGTEYTQKASGTGETGGSWSWDGADDLLLDNYSGTGILAGGDLTVTLKGENEIYYSESKDTSSTEGEDISGTEGGTEGEDISGTEGGTESEDTSSTEGGTEGEDISGTEDSAENENASSANYGSIYVENGDLIITGDGSLKVSEHLYSAIEALNGSITIKGTTVSATTIWDSEKYYALAGTIMSTNGSVNIIDSTVNATWNALKESEKASGTIHAIYATTNTEYADSDSIGASASIINIINSTVTATVYAPNRTKSQLQWTRAISAFSNVEGHAPTININNSTITASAPGGMALLAWSRGIDEAGVINIRNSTLPEGVSVQDIYYTPSKGEPFIGQVLGTGSGTITSLDDPAILDSVFIEAGSFPFEPRKAYAATNESPVTGDSPAGIFATIAAAIAAAGAAIFGRKKMKNLKK